MARTPALPGVKNTVAVSAGKGGVGKTTVSVNVAIALAQAGAVSDSWMRTSMARTFRS